MFVSILLKQNEEQKQAWCENTVDTLINPVEYCCVVSRIVQIEMLLSVTIGTSADRNYRRRPYVNFLWLPVGQPFQLWCTKHLIYHHERLCARHQINFATRNNRRKLYCDFPAVAYSGIFGYLLLREMAVVRQSYSSDRVAPLESLRAWMLRKSSPITRRSRVGCSSVSCRGSETENIVEGMNGIHLRQM